MRRVFELTTMTLAVIGVIVSSAILAYFLKVQLPSFDLILSSISVLLAVLGGAYSVYIVRGLKKLRVAPRVFLSYTPANKEKADYVARELRSAGAFVWFEEGVGEATSSTSKAIEEANSVVVLLSGTPDQKIKFEVGVAQANNIPVIAANTGDPNFSPELPGTYLLRLNPNDPHGLDRVVQTVVRRNRPETGRSSSPR